MHEELPRGVAAENDDIIAYSLPARSNIGQTSDIPESTNPVDQRILDSNNLVRADTAVTGKRNDKHRLQTELIGSQMNY